MKQIAIVSGKGGTGKTTVTACLAELARPAVSADCDVDAANLALLLQGEDGPQEAFFAGQRALVDPALCDGCGLCSDACRFGAIMVGRGMLAVVDEISCEGCKVCCTVCPVDAITMRPNLAGHMMVRQTDGGPLVHARLGIAQDNSGKLVAAVRQRARDEATARGLDIVIIDGPPGIGCPVHAAITGVDLVLAVTEPTPSGAHDLERLLELTRSFQLKVAVLINKADLSERYAMEVERLAGAAGAVPLGRLPFDRKIPGLLARRKTPLAGSAWEDELRASWRKVLGLLYDTGDPKEKRDACC
jgi:MinD superfamily P-loop ATPase